MPTTISRTLEYASVNHSDDEDDDNSDGYELTKVTGMKGDGEGGAGIAWQPRRGDGEMGPHYTPLYSNLKVQRRKHLDASVGKGGAGSCEQYSVVLG